jgi:uncharacterized membrane protein
MPDRPTYSRIRPPGVKDVASGSSTADEIERLAQLQAKGAITDEEFRQAKAKLLA